MAVYVNIKGTNSSRKSTKIDCLLKYLLYKGAIEEINEIKKTKLDLDEW